MGQAQINVRIRAYSRTSIARTKQAALTHNVRGKELIYGCIMDSAMSTQESFDNYAHYGSHVFRCKRLKAPRNDSNDNKALVWRDDVSYGNDGL